jgi:hypothetical protein
MRQVDVSGSVQVIFFPEENDSTINKIVNVESSFLTAWMKNKAMERMKMWPETSGTATPLYLAKRSMLLLPKFQWYESLRPKDPDDVFVVSEEMEELMNQPDESEGSEPKKPALQMPAQPQKPAQPQQQEQQPVAPADAAAPEDATPEAAATAESAEPVETNHTQSDEQK